MFSRECIKNMVLFSMLYKLMIDVSLIRVVEHFVIHQTGSGNSAGRKAYDRVVGENILLYKTLTTYYIKK